MLSGSSVVVVFRFAAAVTNFLSLPVLFQVLGALEFGVYAVGSSIFVYLSALDFGFTDTATLRVASGIGRGRGDDVGVAVLTATALYFLVSCVIGAAIVLCATSLSAFLNVPSLLEEALVGYLAGMTLSWGIQKCATVTAIPLDLSGSFGLSQGLPALQVALLPILSVALIRQGFTLVDVGLAVLLSSLILWVILGLLGGFRLRRMMRAAGEEVWTSKAATTPQGRGFGLAIQINSLSDLVNYSSDRVVVAALLGLGSVSLYEVANRPSLFIRLIALAPVAATFAAVVSLGVTSDEGQSIIKRLGALTTSVSFFLCGLLVLLTEPILQLWVGASLALGAGYLMVVLSIGYTIHATTGVYSAALRSTGNYWLGAIYSASAAILNILMSLLLAPWLGLFGIALGTAIGLALPSLAFLHLVRKPLGLDHAPLVKVLSIAAVTAFCCLIAYYVLTAYEPRSLTGAVLAACCYIFLLTPLLVLVHREEFAPMLRRIQQASRRG